MPIFGYDWHERDIPIGSDDLALDMATILDLGIEDHHIKKGIQKIDNLARLQKIESGKL